jgi:phage repressor protein C with HTH and peptisase S24 domain
MKLSPETICRRIAKVRTDFSGPRGRADFARKIGLSPSTYNYYENNRVPPADVLARIAEVTGVRLEWLILGREPRYAAAELPGHDSPVAQLQHGIADLLAQSPGLAPTLRAFFETLREVSGMKPPTEPPRSPRPTKVSLDPRELVPIVGYTAASPVHFWRELEQGAATPDIDEKIEQILSASDVSNRYSAEVAPTHRDAADPGTVAVVQLSAPDEQGVVEFLDAPAIRARCPDALAWRIDGDSMSPRFQHGDLVIARTGVPARTGHPCIARLHGQIGVVCKLYEEQGDLVRLVPVNDAFATSQFPREQVAWALAVLWSVRVGRQ